MHEKYADQGLKIVAIHVTKAADLKQIKSTVKKKSIPYTIGIDKANETATAYGVKSIPHLFLIDAKGKCIWEGNAPSSSLEQAINRAL